MCMYVRMYICMYICIYVCMYVCMYVYVCMYICMYIRTCMNVYTYVCPHVQVDHIRVDYARRAKKVDVKKLKTKMWDVISRPQEAEKGEEQVRLLG